MLAFPCLRTYFFRSDFRFIRHRQNISKVCNSFLPRRHFPPRETGVFRLCRRLYLCFRASIKFTTFRERKIPPDAVQRILYLEFITQSAQSDDEFPIFFQISPQHLDMRVYRAVVPVKIESPHVIEQLFARQSYPLIAHEIE